MQDVVFALAHATGKIGRFTLIERWRNNERHLAPNDNPLKILMKWGEYSSDVQFILQKSEPQPPQAISNTTTTSPPTNIITTSPVAQQQQQQQQHSQTHRQIDVMKQQNDLLQRPATVTASIAVSQQKKSAIDANNLDSFSMEKEQKKAFNLELKDNVGIVRGVPQQKTVGGDSASPSPQLGGKPATYVLPHLKSPTHSSQSSIDSNNYGSPKKNFNSMDVRNNLDRLSSGSTPDDVGPPISNNGALVPPPYRDPPPPMPTNISK